MRKQIQQRHYPTVKENAWGELVNAACYLFELEEITASRAKEIIGCESIQEFRDIYKNWSES